MDKIANFFFRGRSSWIFPLSMLVLTILLFEITDLDMVIQRLFYSPEDGWMLQFNRHAGFGFVYYTLADLLLIAFGTSSLLATLWVLYKRRTLCWQPIYLLICLIVIPTAVTLVKDTNTMPYPRKIQEFGGKYQRHTLVEAFKKRWIPGAKHHHGWPAGHASGGCSLIALAFVFAKPRHRWLGFAIAALLGGFTGICHTMDGNHFISHNLVTFFMAWTLASWIFLALQNKIENSQPLIKLLEQK